MATTWRSGALALWRSGAGCLLAWTGADWCECFALEGIRSGSGLLLRNVRSDPGPLPVRAEHGGGAQAYAFWGGPPFQGGHLHTLPWNERCPWCPLWPCHILTVQEKGNFIYGSAQGSAPQVGSHEKDEIWQTSGSNPGSNPFFSLRGGVLRGANTEPNTIL